MSERAIEMLNMPEIEDNKAFLLMMWPEQKNSIAKLSFDQKLEWYGYQFQRNAQEATINLSSKDFQRFWKWKVLIPMKIMRMYYRIKNFEIFKKYHHISEMRAKVKKHSI